MCIKFWGSSRSTKICVHQCLPWLYHRFQRVDVAYLPIFFWGCFDDIGTTVWLPQCPCYNIKYSADQDVGLRFNIKTVFRCLGVPILNIKTVVISSSLHNRLRIMPVISCSRIIAFTVLWQKGRDLGRSWFGHPSLCCDDVPVSTGRPKSLPCFGRDLVRPEVRPDEVQGALKFDPSKFRKCRKMGRGAIHFHQHVMSEMQQTIVNWESVQSSPIWGHIHITNIADSCQAFCFSVWSSAFGQAPITMYVIMVALQMSYA